MSDPRRPDGDAVSGTLDSPIGELLIVATDAGLTSVHFPGWRFDAATARPTRAGAAADLLARARAQLAEYFAGARTTFDLPLAAEGSLFQRRVWDALRAIPFGATVSYGELARRLGGSANARAVGAANARNPIPVIVPCHRVLGADGSLVGFGGGIERKRWLLAHEGALPSVLFD